MEPGLGHRIIELAAIEIVDRRLTGNRFHRYLNPERDCDFGALRVHGITAEFLRDKPKFLEIAGEFLQFIAGAELIIHNAQFDIGFLDHELALLDREPLERCCGKVTDTLGQARELHPGRKNSLDALCERYGVNNSARTLHGALLDAELLAEVYLAMTRGQDSLAIEFVSASDSIESADWDAQRLSLIVLRPSEDELALHAQQLAAIHRASGGACVWRRLEAA
jgi:DNA polymerase-3 subunit epsilon